MENPPSAVIIGSFRKDLAEIGAVAEAMRDQGVVVLSPRSQEVIDPRREFVVLRSDCPTKSPRTLQRDVLAKIPRASLVYLVNPTGYVGMSAAAEVAFSALVQTRVLLYRSVNSFGTEVPNVLRDLFANIPSAQEISSRSLADQLALARTHQWNLDEDVRSAVRLVLQSWMQSLSDQVQG